MSHLPQQAIQSLELPYEQILDWLGTHLAGLHFGAVTAHG